MSKKFTKTILSSAVAGLLLVSGGAMAQENIKIGDYTIEFYDNGDSAKIVNEKTDRANYWGLLVNLKDGTITTFNRDEWKKKVNGINVNGINKDKVQSLLESVRYTIDAPSLKKENLDNITAEALDKIKTNVEAVSKIITSETAPAYNAAVRSGMSSENALKIAGEKNASVLLNEFGKLNKNVNQLNKDTTFAIDADGNITLNETAGTGERYGVKDVVADLVADTTVYAEEDGSLTMDNSAPARKRVNEALVDLDKSVRERTTVGVSSDGTLTRAEGAKNTISVNDGLVALSGRTDRIDAAVGAIDGRVTRNTQSIEKNSKAIAANTRTLQQHSARLDSQQRQINENHKEMKRAAAQSAALTGLFQPY
ncbi:hypothetical protein, partial [Escherichia coli]|uniref:hypothetical protein n=1 Tax=Escherichia coli TaxID=562 RepID=UPI0020347CA7